MSIGRHNPARRRSFNARRGAILDKVRRQKTLSPAYWSLQTWKKDVKLYGDRLRQCIKVKSIKRKKAVKEAGRGSNDNMA